MNTIIEGAIREAGRKLRDAYGTNARYREKERYHLMSDLDLEIDTFLTTRVRDAFPDDGVYSEERDELPSESGDRWIVDPIDGTAYFIFGIPFFSISVAKESHGDIVEGHVFNPISDEYFFSDRASGTSTLNGAAIRTSNTSSIAEGLFAYGFSVNPRQIELYLRRWSTIIGAMKKGIPQICPALSICNVARGRIDAFFDSGCSFEGQAAASLILKNAGGAMYDYLGTEYSASTKGGIFTNGNLQIVSPAYM